MGNIQLGVGRQDPLAAVADAIHQGFSVPAIQLGSSDVSTESKIELCLSAFNDLIASGAPQPEVIAKVQSFVSEVNDVLGQDRGAKHAFSMRLAQEPWFAENGQEVRYKPGKNFLSVGGPNDEAADPKRARMEEASVLKGKGKQALPQPMKGKKGKGGKAGLPQPAAGKGVPALDGDALE